MYKQKRHIKFGILQTLTLLILIAGTSFYMIANWPKKAESTKQTKSQKVVSSDPNAKYLVIPEWNIKITLSKPIEDAYYDTKTDSKIDSRSLRSASLSSEPGCAKDPQSIATIFKVNTDAVDIQLNKKYRDTQQGVEIGPNFYFIQTSQFSCTTKPEKAELLQNVRNAFADAAKTIQSR